MDVTISLRIDELLPPRACDPPSRGWAAVRMENRRSPDFSHVILGQDNLAPTARTYAYLSGTAHALWL